MFAAHCPAIGNPVLIWTSSLHGIRNTPTGTHVVFRCACGDDATWITGPKAPAGGQLVHPASAPNPARTAAA